MYGRELPLRAMSFLGFAHNMSDVAHVVINRKGALLTAA